MSRSSLTPQKFGFNIFLANSISVDSFSVNVYFFCLHEDTGSDISKYLLNKHTIPNQIYFLIHITQHILSIWRIKSAFSDNNDHHVILLKSYLNYQTKWVLLDMCNQLVGQLEPLCPQKWGGCSKQAAVSFLHQGGSNCSTRWFQVSVRIWRFAQGTEETTSNRISSDWV